MTEDTSTPTEPVNIPIDIIYEDDYIIAVNKSAGMPTHESFCHRGDTLANALSYYFSSKGKNFVFRAINRLDKDTSGIVLVAKDRISASLLSRQIQQKEIQKNYIAVLNGRTSEKGGEIKTYIRRKDDSIIEREVCDFSSDADLAITKYSTLSRSKNMSCVMATPVTGRTHQLRLHFSSIGHPIVGDTLYGICSDSIGRQSLHAYSLRFIKPFTNEQITVYAPLPQDIHVLLKKERIFPKNILSITI